MMFICLLLLGLLKCEDNPHDAYNQVQQESSKNDEPIQMAQELMDLFISRKSVCSDADTYISTYRWPSLEAINKVVNNMKSKGWRISLEELNLADNIANGCKTGTDMALCESTTPLFINGSFVCMRSLTFKRSIESVLLSDSYGKCSIWTDGSKKICPKVIQVIHFRHKEF